MDQVTFTKAIEKVFNNPGHPIAKEQTIPSIDVSREINIDNLSSVFARLINTLKNTNEAVEMGAIPLTELRKLRAEFYDAQMQLQQLDAKEAQDVIELKSSTKWHERSKLVRLFVTSKAGEQLELEEQEAKQARSAAERFAEELEDLESVINYHILHIGEKISPEFKRLVEEWRTIGQLEEDARSAVKNIHAADNYLPSRSSCHDCGNTVSCGTSTSRSYLSKANNNLRQQLGLLTPWYNRLSVEVENTVNQVRKSLMMSEV